MAVTFDLTAGSTSTVTGTGVTGAVPYDGLNKNYRIHARITLPLAAVSTDILKIVPIAANTLVKGIAVKIVTASDAGTSLVMAVGVASSTAGLDASVNLKATAGTWTLSTPSDTLPALGGYVVTTTEAIQAITTFGAGLATVAGVFDIYVDCEDLN